MHESETLVNHFISAQVCSVRQLPEHADQVNADARAVIYEARVADPEGIEIAELCGRFLGQAYDLGFRVEVARAWFEERTRESWST